MPSNISFQGRLFSDHLFPAQAEQGQYFLARSRCLIDMGNSFLALPEGDNLSPYQKRMFRLECKREDVQLKDGSHLSKDDCRILLQGMFDELPSCEIVRTDFPYFDRHEIMASVRKDRPCLAFFADDGSPPLFISAFLGTYKEKYETNKFVICLKAPGDILPANAGDSWLDCSRIASFPLFYDLPNVRFKHGQCVWEDWKIGDKTLPKTPANHLRPTDSDALRQVVIDKLIDMLMTDPHLDYVDTAIQYDFGTMVEGRQRNSDGEWCDYSKLYEGPPGYIPLTGEQSVAEKTPGRKQSVAQRNKVTP